MFSNLGRHTSSLSPGVYLNLAVTIVLTAEVSTIHNIAVGHSERKKCIEMVNINLPPKSLVVPFELH